MSTTQPADTEFNEYYKGYIDLAVHVPLLEGLAKGKLKTHGFFEDLPESIHEYKYADGKWTPKEILLHLIDTERVFAYRALYFARAEKVDIKGFDQDQFVANSDANLRTMAELLEEYIAVRTGTIVLFKSFSNDTLLRMGVASNAPLSVRAAGYIICGHEKHHVSIINERYLVS